MLVISDAKKDVSSTTGMQDSVRTSPLLAYRADQLVEERLERMKGYYGARDFEGFATLTMQDSNQFHATCQDTYPPIFYMNETSRDVIRMITEANKGEEGVRFGYTFDAGSNAVLFCEKQNLKELIEMVQNKFFSPSTNIQALIRTTSLKEELENMDLQHNSSSIMSMCHHHCCHGHGASSTGGVSSLILTTVGRGAHRDPENQHLIDVATGEHVQLVKGNRSSTQSFSLVRSSSCLLHGFGKAAFYATIIGLVARLLMFSFKLRLR